MTYGNIRSGYLERTCINERHLFVAGDNLTMRDNWKTVRDRMQVSIIY